jgi:hypothetical protein
MTFSLAYTTDGAWLAYGMKIAAEGPDYCPVG